MDYEFPTGQVLISRHLYHHRSENSLSKLRFLKFKISEELYHSMVENMNRILILKKVFFIRYLNDMQIYI